MKNKNIIFLTISSGIALISLVFPWWTSIIWIILISVLLNVSLRAGWWISGIAMALVWLVAAAYFKTQDQTDLIGKTGKLLGGISDSILLIVTVLTGFITGALSGWLGAACAYVLKTPKDQKQINGYSQSKSI